MIVVELPDEAATAALAAGIARLARPSDVIALKGELGTGKTPLARAFLRARGGADAVPRPAFTPVPLAGDASFRRYYRLDDGARRLVLMDAPPPMEDVRSYVAVSAMLRGLGLSAPEIHAEDGARGFLLIEDFGDDVYTRLLNSGA